MKIDPKKKPVKASIVPSGVSADRTSAKYTAFRKEHNAGRDTGSVGNKKTQAFVTAPRVGGPAVKSASPNLVGANKKTVRTAAKLSRRSGTGSGASKQAKASARRAK